MPYNSVGEKKRDLNNVFVNLKIPAPPIALSPHYDYNISLNNS